MATETGRSQSELLQVLGPVGATAVVVGSVIGSGIFFKANDSAKLKAWYRDNLGLLTDGQGETMFSTEGDPGPCLVWAPFPADTTYFEPSKAPFMINFRVKDLRKMLAQLRAAGAAVDDKVLEESYGKFGWAMDPEGNRIELWEPPAASSD